VRDSDTVGRLSGDEFVVLVDGLPGTADGVAERILDMLRSPFEIDTDEGTTIVGLSASIGIARSRHEQSAGDLLRDADTALYAAKNEGRNRAVHFRPEMHTHVSDRFALTTDLRTALDRGELFLAYQPTVELKDGAVTGVEALLRWNHPVRGVVAPADFIPIAEETGLIVDLGRWVLMQACDQAVRWHRAGHRIDMSVNLSARQLDCASLVDDVRTALERTGMDPERLILEITETNLMRDAVATAERLSLLKSLGVRVAIDDFGTGYSSLAYLQQFPIDALKIDRSFVANIARTKEAMVLIHTLVQLGKTLGLTTLAEGIEDEAQLSYLKGEDCDNGQGFLFARPMEPQGVEALLNAARASSSAAVPAPRNGHDLPVPTS
jgi:predicted signal transduction protein with EAL and GGDEF domain